MSDDSKMEPTVVTFCDPDDWEIYTDVVNFAHEYVERHYDGVRCNQHGKNEWTIEGNLKNPEETDILPRYSILSEELLWTAVGHAALTVCPTETRAEIAYSVKHLKGYAERQETKLEKLRRLKAQAPRFPDTSDEPDVAPGYFMIEPTILTFSHDNDWALYGDIISLAMGYVWGFYDYVYVTHLSRGARGICGKPKIAPPRRLNLDVLPERQRSESMAWTVIGHRVLKTHRTATETQLVHSISDVDNYAKRQKAKAKRLAEMRSLRGA